MRTTRPGLPLLTVLLLALALAAPVVAQTALCGTRDATSARRSTSAIMRNITKPR